MITRNHNFEGATLAVARSNLEFVMYNVSVKSTFSNTLSEPLIPVIK